MQREPFSHLLHYQKLRCHYCGYSERVLSNCNSCGKGKFIDFGYGTQQIEEHASELFADYVTKRMDYDTTRKKLDYEQIINDFEQNVLTSKHK